MNIFEVVVITGIVSGSFYGLLALGLQVVYASTGVLNFAVGDIAVIGMFTRWLVSSKWHLSPALGIPIALVVGVVSGLLLYLLCLRLTERAEHLYASLATFALGALVSGLLLVGFGSQLHVVEPIISGPALKIGSTGVQRDSLLVVGGGIVIMALLWWGFQKTWRGLAMRATASSHPAARVLGIDPRAVAALACAISGGIAATAGSLLASQVGARFDFGGTFVVITFVGALLGGISTPVGCAVGGVAVALIDAVVGATVGSNYEAVWLLAIVLVVLLFRPGGVFSTRAAAERVTHGN